MNNQLKCPHCGNLVEITEVLRGEIEQQILAGEKSKHQKELEEVKKATLKTFEEELRLLKEQNAQKEKQLETARAAELDLRKQKNALEDEKRSFELEKQRQLDAERAKIRQKAQEEILETQRLKEKEKDQIIESLKKSLEEAQRKASQGSQQLQGEVLELDLEEFLKTTFPTDLIEPISKGMVGADIRQTVRSARGTVCGTILWESKRTKAWTEGWLSKLKDDTIADRANICALVSETLPQDLKSGIGLRDGVWVCTFSLVGPLAMLLRKSLLDATRQKMVSENRQSHAEQLYTYITGHEFQQQVESMITVYKEMQEQIHKERISFEKSWKQREAQVNKLLFGIAHIYGSMQGIAGSALAPIKSLELESGEHES